MAYLQFFSPVRIELAKEVSHHPALKKLLADHPPEEFEIKLAEIAAYCGVAVDGYLYDKDIDQLCDLCIRRLRHMRQITVC